MVNTVNSIERQIFTAAHEYGHLLMHRAFYTSADLDGEWQSVSRFMHLARKAVLSGMMSLGKLAELLNQNLLEVRSLVKEWRKEFVLAPA
jgi:hypothetical protein